MIDPEITNYFNAKFQTESNTLNGRMDKLEQKLEDFKQYLETDFTFKLIVGMSKVFVTRDELDKKMKSMERRLDTNIDSVETRLTAKIDDIDLKLSHKIDALDVKVNGLDIRLSNLDIKLNEKIDWLAAKIHEDIEAPHGKRLLALEERTQDL